MRILIATSHRNLGGGVERYLQTLIPALAARGHRVGLVYEHRFDAARESIDSPEHDVPACGVAESGAEAASRFVSGWKPDLVYSQGLEAVDLEARLLDAYAAVLYAHNYVGTCATGQKCHAFPSPQPCARQFGIGCLLLHYPRRCGGLHPGTMWTMFQSSAAMNRQLARYEAVLVASAHMRREFQQHRVAPDRIHLVPLPNPQDSAPSTSPARSASRGRILFLGRLTKLKGAEHLLPAIPVAAAKLGRTLQVTIAGDGPERARLEAMAQRLGVAAEFPGWVPTACKADLMAQADLLAVPSVWPEPFGLVGIEAGACGLPAVAYDVGGISEWLVPGHSGELAPGHPPTAEGLAHAIVRALADPEHYRRLCQGAREVASRFTLDTHVSRLEEILGSIRLRPQSVLVSPAENVSA